MDTFVIYKGFEYELLAGISRREFDLYKVIKPEKLFWISNGRGKPLLIRIEELEFLRG